VNTKRQETEGQPVLAQLWDKPTVVRVCFPTASGQTLLDQTWLEPFDNLHFTSLKFDCQHCLAILIAVQNKGEVMVPTAALTMATVAEVSAETTSTPGELPGAGPTNLHPDAVRDA
jgi:hypothetical protein